MNFIKIARWETRRGSIELFRETALPDLPPEALAALIETGAVQQVDNPRTATPYSVQFGGSGKYFKTREAALNYLIDRWGKSLIVDGLPRALELAEREFWGNGTPRRLTVDPDLLELPGGFCDSPGTAEIEVGKCQTSSN